MVVQFFLRVDATPHAPRASASSARYHHHYGGQKSMSASHHMRLVTDEMLTLLSLCKLTAKTIKRKESATHPNSRRAAQLARVAHRESLLSQRAAVRNKTTQKKSERVLTLVGLIDPELESIDLHAMHALVAEDYLSINRSLLEQERKARRSGRPPSAKEAALSEAVRKEEEEYDNGMDVPDLRNPVNVRLLREWNGDSQMLPLYDFIRISRKIPEVVKLIQVGSHKLLVLDRQARENNHAAPAQSGEVDMDDAAPAVAA